MDAPPSPAFAVRLRDLLATLESAALLGAAEIRLRGLGEQLQFACLALPCTEALVALEIARLGRLTVPGVASADGWRPTELDFMPSGTPFAYLLGGGGGYAAEIAAGDPMLEVLQPVLGCEPRQCIFVPIRVGAGIVGGAALLRDEAAVATAGEDAEGRTLGMAERLAEVLALTIESFRTERVLLQLFAQMLPDLCAADAPTGFLPALDKHIHSLRIDPSYQRRMQLAQVVGRIAAQGEAETRLVTDLLERMARYMHELVDGERSDELAPFSVDP
jgi:hypothetical protein